MLPVFEGITAMKKIMLYIICIAIIMSSLSFCCFSEAEEDSLSVEEIIRVPTLEDTFVPGEILVTIKKEYSAPNKAWFVTDFLELDLLSVEDLFMIENLE